MFEEKAKKLNVPLISPLEGSLAGKFNIINPIIAVCGECGMDITRVMINCCNNSRCPTGLAPPAVIVKGASMGSTEEQAFQTVRLMKTRSVYKTPDGTHYRLKEVCDKDFTPEEFE